MRSLPPFKQTTIIQQAVITFAVGILCLNAIQLQVSGLFFSHNRAADTTHNGTNNLRSSKDIINLEIEIVKSFDELTRHFNAVTNASTASFVIPNINHFRVQLDYLNSQMDRLPAVDQASVIMITTENLGLLEVAIDDLMKIPGVALVLESNVTQLMNKLSKQKKAALRRLF